MKLQRKAIERDGSGSVGLIPQEPEDLWHVYNLIAIGDHITATAIRRVQKETATGSTDSERVRVTLTIEVKAVDFDTGASAGSAGEGGELRISGRTIEENKWVKVGSFHTLTLEAKRNFTLWKAKWDNVALSRLTEACSEKTRASVAALVMAEGVANLCLLTDQMTITKAHISQNIPRKRKASAGHHDKAVERFYQACYDAILRGVAFETVKCIVIASPGFVKEQFYEFLLATAVRTDARPILENKSKFLLVHSSTGHKHSLTEVLKDKSVQAQLSDTKAAKEVTALQTFYDVLKKEPDRAVYGFRHVQACNEQRAIQTLLVSDSLFRSRKVEIRTQYVQLVDDVKLNGGEVFVFSSLHVSGEQLTQLTGVAAMLRFPIPGLDEELDGEDLEDDEKALHSSDDDTAPKGGLGSDEEGEDGESVEVDLGVQHRFHRDEEAEEIDERTKPTHNKPLEAPAKGSGAAAAAAAPKGSAKAPAPAAKKTSAPAPKAAAKKAPAKKPRHDDDYDDYDDRYDDYD